MPETEKSISIDLQYKAVELISTNLSRPVLPLPVIQNFNFIINLEHKFDKENKFFLVLVNIVINIEGSAEKAGEVLINNVFFVENYEEVVIEKDGVPVGMPINIAETLNSISISTARGFLAQQFRGTWLHNAILPIINPKDLQVVTK